MKNYRDVLRDIYNTRKKRNPSYSLLAFSRDAGFKSYHICDILRGTYGLSPARAVKVAEHLKMPPQTKEEFIALVQLETSRNDVDRASAQEKLKIFQYSTDKQVTADDFKPLSSWHNMAIIELLRKFSTMPNNQALASMLGITLEQATESVQLLTDNRVLEIFPDSTFKIHFQFLSVKSQPSEIIRKYHHELIKKGVLSIENTPFNERTLSSFMVLLTEEEYANFAMEIVAFIRNKVGSIQDDINSDRRLHAINMQLFPIETKQTSTTQNERNVV